MSLCIHGKNRYDKQSYLKYLLKESFPIDVILVSNLKISKKIELFDDFVDLIEINNIRSGAGITSLTMTLLLKEKEETLEYMNLFKRIVDFSNIFFSKPIFTYDHLYHLIIQAWMVLPLYFSTEFLKKMIIIALGGTIPEDILMEFKLNAHEWFVNLKNSTINDMINWLCTIDLSGELTKIKNAYEKNLLQEQEIEKAFKKKFNMTRKEYETKQQQAKSNGLCKFVRDGTLCPYSTRCKFYHGNLEETYAIQPCRNHNKCQFLQSGECMFMHQPTDNQLVQLTKFYKILAENNYLLSKSQSVYVDKQCETNPFVILKKTKDSDYVQYCVPKCSCEYIDSLGIIHCCDKQVVFMTKNFLGKPKNFYCSYEHMITSEKPISYCVKQNALAMINISNLNC